MKARKKAVEKTEKTDELKELKARVEVLTQVVRVLADSHQKGPELVKQLDA